MRKVRFRTLGCYPLTGAVESDCDDVAGNHSGNVAGQDFGTAGTRHRLRPSGIDGRKEEGRLLLARQPSLSRQADGSATTISALQPRSFLRYCNTMSHQSDLIATDIDAYLAQHERKELLRFLDLWQRGRRQEHADRPFAVRFEDDLRRSTGRRQARIRWSTARPVAILIRRC